MAPSSSTLQLLLTASPRSARMRSMSGDGPLWSNQLRLSAIRWRLEHEGHSMMTIPLVYECLLIVRWVRASQTLHVKPIRRRPWSAAASEALPPILDEGSDGMLPAVLEYALHLLAAAAVALDSHGAAACLEMADVPMAEMHCASARCKSPIDVLPRLPGADAPRRREP